MSTAIETTATTIQTLTSGKQTTYYKSYKPTCHKGFTEVYKNLYVGREADIINLIQAENIHVLMPLNDVDGKIWDTGWRGQIIYTPIQDFSVLPKDLEKHFVKQALKALKQNKKVAIFCIGGHGRTGYFASLILSRLGIKDPIEHIRKLYCKEAVECNAQVKAIAEFSNNPELEKKHKITYSKSGYYDNDFYASLWNDYETRYQASMTDKNIFDNVELEKEVVKPSKIKKITYKTTTLKELQSFNDPDKYTCRTCCYNECDAACYFDGESIEPDNQACAEYIGII